MSKIDLRNLRAAKATSFSKSTSIETISMKTREMMKPFCQINQIFEDKENVIICEYYSNKHQQSYYRKYDLYILHLNISSLSSHIDGLKALLSLITAKVEI